MKMYKYVDYLATKKTFIAIILIILTLVGYLGLKLDRMLLDRGISVYGIMLIDLFIGSTIVLAPLLLNSNRKDIENDIKKLRMSDIIKTILLMAVGTILGYVSDIGLKYHTPESLGIIDLIISFVFSGITFYFFSGENYTIYSVIAYILTIILAILSQTI
uniref:Uncharacterized protein n=1 Tax=viral metagenome TaxID=1070528 RepID=A0A6C0JDJ2_9ZZZZ